MQCHDLDRILNDHAISALGRGERNAVDEHLRDCRRCAPLWQAHELLASEAAVTTPAGLFERVLDDVDSTGVSGSSDGIPRDVAAGPPRKVSDSVSSRVADRGLRRLSIPFGLAAAAALVAMLVYLPSALDSAGPSGVGPAPATAADTARVADAEARNGAVTTAAGAIGPAAERFVEGVHYRVVAAPAADAADAERIEVEEFFMYGCPHCYTFEGLFNPWCEIQPDYVNVRRVPVVFNAVAGMHARAFYTAELLGIDERIHGEMLAAIHDRGERLATETELAEFAAQFGVAERTYLETFRSAEVTTLVEAAVARMRSLGVRATPTVIVGGRYEISPGQSGSFEDMLAVADQLIDQLHAQRSAGDTAD